MEKSNVEMLDKTPDEIKNLDDQKIDQDQDEIKPKKRKYTRRKKAKKIELPVQSKPLIEILFNNILADRFGEKWRLTNQESEALGRALDDVIMKYSVTILEKYSEEMTLIVTASAIIIPRLLMKESGNEKK
ncbi:MAG: hypothetical protein ACTSVV_14440 [Promethearchaeota archaeon]